MELNVLLRGQSNAYYLTQSPDWPSVATRIQQLLGFDGVTNTVNLLASYNDPFGKNTINGGTAFIGDWVTTVNGNYQNGWTNNTLETGLINYINSLSAPVKAAPTAVVWLQNEYDSTNPTLTTPEWTSAVQFEAQQVRAAFGQTATTVPYVFVNAIPYGSGSIDSVNQAIKLGMEQLTANPQFHADIGVQANDVSMDYGQTGIYGGPHMDSADGNLIDQRLAASVAQTFAQYALPGSPIATGQVDAFGPEVMMAQLVGSNQVLVTVAPDKANLNATLSTDAANGVGWSILDNGTTIQATAAQVYDSTQVLLTFGSAVPTDATAGLFYAYGYGRLAASDSDPGHGTAIYDAQQMPIWAPASGVQIADAAPAGYYFEQNMSTGNIAGTQGYASSSPNYQSEFTALSADSVVVTAATPNAFLVSGHALDVLIATSGNNLLSSGQTESLLAGGTGTGQDTFVADGSAGPLWDVIANFHVGDSFVLWGAASATAAQYSWSDTSGGAILTVAGGGVNATQVEFLGITAAQAQSTLVHNGGSAGGMSYTSFTNIG